MFPNNNVFLSLKVVLILANSTDTDQMQHDAAFHLGLHCFPKYPFRGFQVYKGALSWYGKLTWESAHAWNLITLCLLFVWGMTFIFMVHLSFYAIPLLIYDVMYDITTIP